MTTERVQIEKKERGENTGLGGALKGIFTSRALISVILATILLLLATLMSQGINTYLFADYFKDTKALALFSLLNLPSGGSSWQLFPEKFPRATEKKESAAIGCFWAGIIYLIIYFLHTKSLAVFITLSFFAMLGMNYFNMLIWALITDVIDDKEVRTHSRDDGTVYGFYSFARKVGQALAGGVSGFALSAIGYDSLARRKPRRYRAESTGSQRYFQELSISS